MNRVPYEKAEIQRSSVTCLTVGMKQRKDSDLVALIAGQTLCIFCIVTLMVEKQIFAAQRSSHHQWGSENRLDRLSRLLRTMRGQGDLGFPSFSSALLTPFLTTFSQGA